jgi:proteic killer suppression protein
LDLAFSDRALRYVCESEARARKTLGAAAAADLHARLSDLEAIDAVTEMSWVPIMVEGARVRIEFHRGFRLLADANEAKPPLLDGLIDWSRVGRLLLREIKQT